MKYKHYCKKMKKSGEWGDHVTLQAAADKFAAKICLLTSFRDTCFVEIVPQYQAPQRDLLLQHVISLTESVARNSQINKHLLYAHRYIYLSLLRK
jgi:hypothetical protein